MKRAPHLFSLLVVFVLANCASNSGVVPVGPDTFMVSRQAATGFTGMGALKAKALQEAEDYCASRSKVMQVISTMDSEPPYLAGNFPRTEVQFMCLASDDPELARPKLRREPDVVVESRSAPGSAAQTSAQNLVDVAIASEPANADVYVDGAFVGSTPLPTHKLEPGEHEIEITRSGYKSWRRTILVKRGVSTSVRAVLDPDG